MPSKRVRTARAPAEGRITLAAVEAFLAGDAVALASALGIRPWEINPLDTEPPRPAWADPDAWAEAAEMREALEEHYHHAD